MTGPLVPPPPGVPREFVEQLAESARLEATAIVEGLDGLPVGLDDVAIATAAESTAGVAAAVFDRFPVLGYGDAEQDAARAWYAELVTAEVAARLGEA